MSFRKPCHMPLRKLIPPFTLTDIWAMAICMLDRVYIRLSLAINDAVLISATQQDMFLNSEVSIAIYSHEMWGKKKRTA